MGKSAYKALSFSTTVRNPTRYKLFIEVLLPFNGQILTNAIIDKVVFELVARKLYIPNFAKKKEDLKKQLICEDVRFSDIDTKLIIENSPQSHKEAGFDKGWPSRFSTWYQLAKELGFLYYKIGEHIDISESGLNLTKSLNPEFAYLEQQVFLNAFAKYQRKNPFRRVKNTNQPLILLLKTIKELRKIYQNECKGLFRREIPLILCWQNGDAVNLANQIKNIRDKYGFKSSDDYIYEFCLGLLETDNMIKFKKSQIIKETPDDFIRKMRLTGLITLRGNGRFIDFNNLEIDKINYLLETYTNLTQEFSNEYQYYEYMKLIDNNLVSIKPQYISSESKKEKLLKKWVKHFKIEDLKKELAIVSDSKKKTANFLLKYINEPIRFEFLTAIALKKAFTNLHVIPNYCIDDEGLPTSFAPGGQADINCYDNEGNILFEVTLLTGTQQNIREMPSISRHLQENIDKDPKKDSFSVMICPRVHTDTRLFADFIKEKQSLNIVVIDTKDFIRTLEVYESARKYKPLIIS